ncbi:MAG: hypothetical protein ACJ8AO_15175 [Gemmatimonadaceae bacterium]
MTAGLPGAGIGGIFYLASALLMPVRELWGFVHDPRAPRRWGLALRQASLAGGILAALWATGWLLALVLPESARTARSGAPGLGAAGAVGHNVLKVGALLFSLGTLALVLGAVQAARLVARRRPAPALPAPVRIPTPAVVRALRDPLADRHRHPTRWRPSGEHSGQFPRYAS